MITLLETLKITGAILGILAFVWKIGDVLYSYLHIALTVDIDGVTVSAKTTVENKNPIRKKVDNALLLVGLESESPIDTFNKLSSFISPPKSVQSTNELASIRLEKPIYDEAGRAVIPLPFYKSENSKIGNEKLTYRVPIDTTHVRQGVPYSVRFFLWAKGHYHRSTQDAFLLRELTAPPTFKPKG